MDTEDARLEQLKLAVATRNLEVQTTWTRFNAIAVLQVAGLGAFCAGVGRLARFESAVLAGVGLLVAICWCQLINRGYYWVQYWNKRIGEVETAFRLTPDVFGPSLRSAQNDGVTTAGWARGVALTFATGWALLLIRALCGCHPKPV